MAGGISVDEEAELEIHAAVARGRLREYTKENPIQGKAVLYRIVSELVYERITRPAERARAHRGCAVSIDRLTPDCHDRHQDDVEAVLADVLKHADRPIANLRGWLVPRLRPVTVDANRVRRGARGALQRPRLPHWLDTTLGSDRWLTELALEILNWVGVPTAASNGIWPLAAWAERRDRATGEHGCTEVGVASDVERVLAAMRTRPTWYEKYVERPLGHKQAPLPPPSRGSADSRDLAPLPPSRPDEIEETLLQGLIADAIAAVETRLRAGEAPRAAVLAVLHTVFSAGPGTEDIDKAPGHGTEIDEQASRLLADPATLDRVVAEFLQIIKDA